MITKKEGRVELCKVNARLADGSFSYDVGKLVFSRVGRFVTIKFQPEIQRALCCRFSQEDLLYLISLCDEDGSLDFIPEEGEGFLKLNHISQSRDMSVEFPGGVKAYPLHQEFKEALEEMRTMTDLSKGYPEISRVVSEIVSSNPDLVWALSFRPETRGVCRLARYRGLITDEQVHQLRLVAEVPDGAISLKNGPWREFSLPQSPATYRLVDIDGSELTTNLWTIKNMRLGSLVIED